MYVIKAISLCCPVDKVLKDIPLLDISSIRGLIFMYSGLVPYVSNIIFVGIFFLQLIGRLCVQLTYAPLEFLVYQMMVH